MINRFKGLFKKLKENQRAILKNQNQQTALFELKSMFSCGNFIPMTGWSMSPRAIVHCLNIIVLTDRKNILELGGGATTLYIAQLLKITNSNGKLTCIESDPEWFEKLKIQLETYGLTDYVNLILAPLTKVPSRFKFRNQDLWYDTTILEDKTKDFTAIDFVIVDGPYGGASSFSRYSAYPFFKAKSTSDIFWLLDDTGRNDEDFIVKEWQKLSNLQLSTFDRYSLLYSSNNYDLAPYKNQ